MNDQRKGAGEGADRGEPFVWPSPDTPVPLSSPAPQNEAIPFGMTISMWSMYMYAKKKAAEIYCDGPRAGCFRRAISPTTSWMAGEWPAAG